jgi:uncharacterized protein YecE (DUF72 family)
VGVSGFSYQTWKPKFYRKETKSDEFLSEYCSRLNSVEINSSFYAPPRSAVVTSWSQKAIPGFKFSFKAPKQITHILKLGNGAADSASRLSATLSLLGPKRGPVLFQLPPFMPRNDDVLERFLEATSAVQERVFEFRHESWLEAPTFERLDKHGAGFCVAETEEMNPILKSTGTQGYFRLRRDSYDDSSIVEWSKKIHDIGNSVKECYVYLRHDADGSNAILAEKLSKRLS